MSITYRILYRVGVTPWERMASLPVAGQIDGLFTREEAGREPPYGPVLDLGCGSGIWAVELAKRGWQVTGLDFVPTALGRARERAAEAGVELRLVEGDVTKLTGAGVGSGFPFLLDIGLFHDELTDEQRQAMGREVTQVAAPGATLVMMAWARGRRGPLPRGASRAEIEVAYPKLILGGLNLGLEPLIDRFWIADLLDDRTAVDVVYVAIGIAAVVSIPALARSRR